MTAPVMLRHLEESSIPATGAVRVVREWDCEGFDVSRRESVAGIGYTVRNRTAWMAGERYARTLSDVRDLIARTP